MKFATSVIKAAIFAVISSFAAGQHETIGSQSGDNLTQKVAKTYSDYVDDTSLILHPLLSFFTPVKQGKKLHYSFL